MYSHHKKNLETILKMLYYLSCIIVKNQENKPLSTGIELSNVVVELPSSMLLSEFSSVVP